MKKRTLFVAMFVSFTLQVLGQSSVVALHSPTNGVQYFNNASPLVAAYNAAIAGDTIYIPGGTFVNPAKYEKKLTIYGAGHFPDATTATLPTKLTGNFIISDEADGLHLEGVELSNGLSFDINEAVSNVIIKRNRIIGDISIDQNNGTLQSENNYFIENILWNVYNIKNLINSYFINNIIENVVNNSTQNTFLNNLFLLDSSSNFVISNSNASLFKNNIFIKSLIYSDRICSSPYSSTWINNVFCNATPNLGTSPIAIGNYYSAVRADILVNQTGLVFDYTHDYHLQTAASATYLGDDTTECGIYGGISPFKDMSVPINPHISSAVISSQSDANGMINVNINVQAQTR